MYLPRGSPNQIHCYMNRQDPNPGINPGDAVAALTPPPTKLFGLISNSAILNGKKKTENLHTREEIRSVSSRGFHVSRGQI